MSELKTYRGNCHCKQHVFEFQSPEITSGYECNCSSCHKRGGLAQYIPGDGDVNFVKGNFSTLTTFTFPGANFELQFCPRCGNNLFVYGSMTPGKPPVRAVNLLMVQDLDISQLEKKFVDGASLPTKYITPRYQGPEPSGTSIIEEEGGDDKKTAVVYTGGCFCGDVTLAVKTSKPLDDENVDSSQRQEIVSCNCSHCSRIQALWIYIRRDQLVVSGRENLTLYQMGELPIQKTFCKRCGCHLSNDHLDLTDEEIQGYAGENEMIRSGMMRMRDRAPFNMRALDRDSGGGGGRGIGIDMGKLNIREWTEGKDMGGTYVNP